MELKRPPRKRRSWLLPVALGLAAVLGLGAGAYGGLQVKRELDRPPTRTEKDIASVQEMAMRWRTLPAGEIFPETVDYGEDGMHELATRVGIAPQASCAKALDAAIAKVVTANGCTTVLRATYLDATQTIVSTVGVAVLPDEASVWKSSRSLRSQFGERGVRPVAFPGTLSALFGDSARQNFAATEFGNYLIFAAGGFGDGRPQVGSDRPQIFAFGDRIVSRVGGRLRDYVDPCTVKRVVAC
jgi:hypothetical protein